MPNFETPIFLKPTDPKGDVIVFGKSPELEAADNINGIARFGGTWRAPSYVLAYLKSAAILVNHGVHSKSLDDIALPAFYLQRHALELLIKRLLSWLYEIAEFQAESGNKSATPSRGQINRFKREHGLEALSRDLQKTSIHFGFGEPPPEIGVLVRKIGVFEISETWSRYESTERKDGTRIHHLDKEVEVPIVGIQHELEALYASVSHRQEDHSTYENMLYDAWESAALSAGHIG